MWSQIHSSENINTERWEGDRFFISSASFGRVNLCDVDLNRRRQVGFIGPKKGYERIYGPVKLLCNTQPLIQPIIHSGCRTSPPSFPRSHCLTSQPIDPPPTHNSQLTGHQGTASSSVFRDSWATFALWGSFPAWAHPLILMEYMLCTSRGNKNANQQWRRCFISSCFPLEMAQAFFVLQSESDLILNANTQPFFPSTIPSALRSVCFRSLWAAVRYHY